MARELKPTKEQAAFAESYAYKHNAIAAWRDAFPTVWAAMDNDLRYEARRKASEMLEDPVVQRLIVEFTEDRFASTAAEADRIIDEYSTIAFANLAHYYDFGPDGTATPRFEKVPEHAWRAVKSVETHTYQDGDKNTVKKVKLEFHDKLNALNSLAKMARLWVELNQTNVNVDNRQVHVHADRDDEVLQRIEEKLRGFSHRIQDDKMLTDESNEE